MAPRRRSVTVTPVTAGRRAQVVGTGLIGGSIGLALRAQGWHVTGRDREPGRAEEAERRGALDHVGDDPEAELVVVATPVAAVAAEIEAIVGRSDLPPDVVITDVAGVKAPVAAAVDHPRFVGGHPMAGSEQVGVAGADPALFVGATWVLTPTRHTDPDAFARARAVVRSLGAEVVDLTPEQHDALVAVVSHVPHLTAAALMNLAGRRSEEHAVLLRLAAGGFRDMTRVAAGHPEIWPDVCTENAAAIVATLDALVEDLSAIRDRVAGRDRPGILALLSQAAQARRALPTGAPQAERLLELRVPISDRPGELAEVTTLAGNLGVNLFDIEIAHSTEGDAGVLVLVVDAAAAPPFQKALTDRGYRSSSGPLP